MQGGEILLRPSVAEEFLPKREMKRETAVEKRRRGTPGPEFGVEGIMAY